MAIQVTRSAVFLFVIVCGVTFVPVTGIDEDVKREFSRLNDELDRLKFAQRVTQEDVRKFSSGSTYVRWGRTTCEGDARIVYRGYMAGPRWDHSGGGSNYICLHESPQWNKYIAGFAGWGGIVFGVEYEQHGDNNVFSTANHGGQSVENFPAPCVVCYVSRRSAVLTVPGRMECPSGFTKEYDGYMASDAIRSNHHRTQHICLDGIPETAIGGVAITQSVIYPVQVACGSLPCSRYIDGRELTCVVCTK